MFLQIENFLTPPELQTIAELAQRTQFIDGRRSNPHNTTKNNLIADPEDPAGKQASQIALNAFQRSRETMHFVFPRRVAQPILTRYGTGMAYGAHADSAFLPLSAQPLRADVSCTLFISDPTTYRGGELVVHLGSESVQIKSPAGHAIFYPSTAMHQVAPVTSGERLVMLTFIESQIPDQMQRHLLYALGEVHALEGLKMDWRNRTQLQYVIANLHRMWAA